MRRLLAAALACSTGCSAIYQVDAADRPATAAEVVAWTSDLYDAALQARAACSGTSLEHARTLWLGPKASHVARAQALFATARVRLDRDLSRACLAAVAAALPACTRLDEALLDPAGPCQRAWAGILADGAECGADVECRPGAFCDPGGGACPGRCAAYRREAERCDADLPCGHDLDCHCGFGVGPCAEPTCHRRTSREGDPCGATGGPPCGPGLYCSLQEQRCLPRLAAGAACGSGLSTDTDGCRPELYCDSSATPPSCAFRLMAAYRCPPGARACVPSAWCDAVTDPTNPRCQPYGTAGAACGARPNGEVAGCLEADCLGGACEALPAYGAPCGAGQRCAPLSTPATCQAASGRCGEVCG